MLILVSLGNPSTYKRNLSPCESDLFPLFQTQGRIPPWGGSLVLTAGWGWELTNLPQASHPFFSGTTTPQERLLATWGRWWSRKKWVPLKTYGAALLPPCCRCYRNAVDKRWSHATVPQTRQEGGGDKGGGEGGVREGAGESERQTDLLCGMALSVHLVVMHPNSAEFRIRVEEDFAAAVHCAPQGLLEIDSITGFFGWITWSRYAHFQRKKRLRYNLLTHSTRWLWRLLYIQHAPPSLLSPLLFWPSISWSLASYLDSPLQLSHQSNFPP